MGIRCVFKVVALKLYRGHAWKTLSLASLQAPLVRINHATLLGETEGPHRTHCSNSFKTSLASSTSTKGQCGSGLIPLPTGRTEEPTRYCCRLTVICRKLTGLGKTTYRELLQLVTIYLGGVVKRVHSVPVQIRKPSALHRARFMASSLYLLKRYLFHDQFTKVSQSINDAMILLEYIALSFNKPSLVSLWGVGYLCSIWRWIEQWRKAGNGSQIISTSKHW